MDRLEALYRQHAAAVLRFAWGLSGDRSTAEDIVAETFARVLTRAPRIETSTALAYLLAVARNTFLTGLRHRRREVPLSDDLLAPAPDVESRLDDRARLDAVRRALRDMPEGERAALLLRVDHELSYDDIAAALDISVGAARVRVHRARLRLASAPELQGRLT
jgi:RNA polymerase sigma-70 factor (ECF subfamily)